jgi:FKBP-type peptidyl-prolyl cis-trans isomerase FklB
MKFVAAAIVGLGLLCTNVYAAETSSAATNTSQGKSTMTGDSFLAANRLKPDVVTLPDGLQYKILTQGKGPKPKDADVVVVHYVGTLIDGTEFDSSYKRNEPATFPVNGVIPGWVEALKLMPVGSTWMLFIPAQLAYGEQGAPPAIGPNQTLVFKVSLLEIKKS